METTATRHRALTRLLSPVLVGGLAGSVTLGVSAPTAHLHFQGWRR